MTKKKEEPRDLAIESWSNDLKDNIDVVFKHRISAQVIDTPPTIFMTFPKDLPSAGLGCAIYNALEREKGSNVVWRIG